jgi:hypothetical protein
MIERANSEHHDWRQLLAKTRERLEAEAADLERADAEARSLPAAERAALEMRIAKFKLDCRGLKDAEAALEL